MKELKNTLTILKDSNIYLGILIAIIYIILFVLLSALLTKNDLISYPPDSSFKTYSITIWNNIWDGAQYMQIAEKGYKFPQQAFFPLLPALIGFLNYFLPLSLAGRINLLLLPILFVLLLEYLSNLGYDFKIKLKLLSLFLIFPTSFYLFATYTETLFIIFALCSIRLIQLEKYKFALIPVILGSMTKPQGVALIILLIVSFVITNLKKLPKIQLLYDSLILSILSITGVASYFYYLHAKYGDFKIFFKAQSNWLRSPSTFEDLVSRYTERINFTIDQLSRKGIITRELIEFAFFAFIVFLILRYLRKLNWKLAIYSTLVILIPLSTFSLLSLPRFTLLAFPLLFEFFKDIIKNKFYLRSYLILALTIQIYLIIKFHSNFFIG